MTFASIEQFKGCAQFFPKGRIIPARILKIVRGNKRHAYCVTFGSDAWALPVNGSYVVANDSGKTGCAVRLVAPLRNAHLSGSPYGQGGTYWIGNCDIDERQWLQDLNAAIAEKRSAAA